MNSNKRVLLVSALLVVLSLMLVGSVLAERVNYTGELTTSDPVLGFEGPLTFYYDAYEFTVDTNGVYSIIMDEANFNFSDDPMFALYEDDLDPGDPFGHLIYLDDDSGEGLLPLIETTLTECTTYVLVVTSYEPEDTGSYAFHITGPGNIGPNACGEDEGAIAGNLLDGRINNDSSRDVAAPIAVYCANDGTFDVYAIDANSGEGTLAFRATTEQVTTPVSENTLLSSSLGVSVYRLATGEFSIFATFPDGKPYAFLFDACPPTRTEHPF